VVVVVIAAPTKLIELTAAAAPIMEPSSRIVIPPIPSPPPTLYAE